MDALLRYRRQTIKIIKCYDGNMCIFIYRRTNLIVNSYNRTHKKLTIILPTTIETRHIRCRIQICVKQMVIKINIERDTIYLCVPKHLTQPTVRTAHGSI